MDEVGPVVLGRWSMRFRLFFNGYLKKSKQFQKYLNWDMARDRRHILANEDLLAPVRRPDRRPLLVFDELHKMRRFKGWPKGFYDEYGNEASIRVTGSARLDAESAS